MRHAVAGGAAGVAGALAMELVALAVAPAIDRAVRPQRQPPSGIGQQAPFQASLPGEGPTGKVASDLARVGGDPLTKKQKRLGALAVHLAFGAALGALYGISADRFPEVSVGGGLPFGVAVWLGAAQIGVPVASLSKPPSKSPAASQVFGLGAHLLFGAVVRYAYAALSRKTGTDTRKWSHQRRAA